MAETDVSICSAALMELGGSPINSFDTPGDVAKFLKIRYPQLRAGVIGSYPWECMKVRKALTRETAAASGFRFSFLMPADMIGTPGAVFLSNEPWTRATSGFEVRGRRIVSNYDKLWMEYSAVRPESEWPSFMVELMIAVVKEAIAFMLTDQQNVKDAAYVAAYGTPSENRTGGLMGLAMTTDAQGSGNNPGLANDAFVAARFGGVYPGDWF